MTTAAAPPADAVVVVARIVVEVDVVLMVDVVVVGREVADLLDDVLVFSGIVPVEVGNEVTSGSGVGAQLPDDKARAKQRIRGFTGASSLERL